jgi:hypothetical protein
VFRSLSTRLPTQLSARRTARGWLAGDRGQATADLAAGGIALGVIAWANGTGSFTDLFESVIGKLSGSL